MRGAPQSRLHTLIRAINARNSAASCGRYNRRAIGHYDARGLGFVIRDEAGRTIGVAAGYSWAGTSELKQMWVDEVYRGRGYARELLDAFVAEAANRGV